MKGTAILYLILLGFCCTGMAQSSVSRSDECAEIQFSRDTVNLGKLHLNDHLIRNVTIKNTGKCPLILYSVLGGYVRETNYDKYFYQPGDSGTLTIEYVATKPGKIFQALTAYSSAKTFIKFLYVTGEVMTPQTCAVMAFDKDTLDLGSIPFVIGKHFMLNVYNKGTCPMAFTVHGGDDKLNLLSFSTEPVKPGDAGTIEIHLGAQEAGDYKGALSVESPDIPEGFKMLYIKAKLLPKP